MTKPKAVFLDAATLGEEDIDWTPLDDRLDCAYYPATAQQDIASRLADTRIVISNKVVLDAESMDAAPHLELICVAATGTNNIDLEAARERDIPVCNVRDYGTPSVAQHVFTLILALSTRLLDYTRAVQAGDWGRSPHFCLLDYPIAELAGKRLGIIGHGVLGSAVARLGEAFGMDVLIAQRPGGDAQPGRVPLVEFWKQADVISLHCPLTDATRRLIGSEELRAMKSTALLINTARGGIVDEMALAAALRDGEIAGAGIDVLGSEPPVESSPLLADGIPNLLVTPHIAWASRESRQRLLAQIADNIDAWASGEPRNRVI